LTRLFSETIRLAARIGIMRALKRCTQHELNWAHCFVLIVRQDENPRGRDWTALMVDVDPDDLKNCTCDFPARFYVHPDHYRPVFRTAHQCWVRIKGKHRNRTAAWHALEGMMATRH
jgi:hypothetical protein